MAAPAFGAIGSLTTINNTSSVSRPAVTEGDLMILVVELSYADADLSGSGLSGWTSIDYCDNENLFSVEFRVFWKLAGPSEASSYSLTISGQGGGNNFGSAVILTYTGVHQTTPINVSASQFNSTSSTSIECPSVTTTVADTRLVCVYAENGLSAMTYTPAGSMTERLDARDSTGGVALGIADESVAATGATGTRTNTASASTASWGLTFAIAPSGGGGGGGQPKRSMQQSRLRRA